MQSLIDSYVTAEQTLFNILAVLKAALKLNSLRYTLELFASF